MVNTVRHRVLSLACLLAVTGPAAHADGEWQAAARLDAPRAGLSVVVLDGRLYAAGGAGLTDPRAEFESYDTEIDRWMPEQSLPRGLERFGMSVADGRIYAAGGYAAGEMGVGPSAAMWSWSPEHAVWQSEAAMPAAKADFTLTEVGGLLYAIGGSRDDGEFYVFDPESREWENGEVPEGVTRAAAAAVAIDDEILIVGGFYAGAPTARSDFFNPATGEWREGPALPAPRSGVAIAYDGERVHVFGGQGGEGNTTLDEHLVWTPGESGWESAEGLPSPRTNAAAANLNDGIYIVGGGSGGGVFAPFTALDVTDVYLQGEG